MLDAGGTNILASNDNWNNVSYVGCDATDTCPVNGPFPSSFFPEPLSSRIDFTPSATASYIIQVKRSTVAPPSSGLFGAYTLQISR